MAKLSSINNNKKRQSMIANKAQTRAALKAEMMNKETSFERRIEVAHKMAEMPRNSSSIRYRNRCELSGRSRGYHRKFKISRIALRDLASMGLLPGVVKSSW
jgi:small subunit ribosomal protein S14